MKTILLFSKLFVYIFFISLNFSLILCRSLNHVPKLPLHLLLNREFKDLNNQEKEILQRQALSALLDHPKLKENSEILDDLLFFSDSETSKTDFDSFFDEDGIIKIRFGLPSDDRENKNSKRLKSHQIRSTNLEMQASGDDANLTMDDEELVVPEISKVGDAESLDFENIESDLKSKFTDKEWKNQFYRVSNFLIFHHVGNHRFKERITNPAGNIQKKLLKM